MNTQGGMIGSEGSVSKYNMQEAANITGLQAMDAQSNSSHVIAFNESSK